MAASSDVEPTSNQEANTIKVALIQASSDMGSHEAIQKNTEKFKMLIEKAASNGAKIVVLPEMAITVVVEFNIYSNLF